MEPGVLLFHASVLGLYMYVNYFLQVEVVEKSIIAEHPTLQNIGRYSRRYLTHWTFWVQTVYWLLAVISHLTPQKLRGKLTVLTDYIFTCIAAPMALFVTVTFWGIYLIDRELVYPPIVDKMIPVWVNHCIHTFNAFFPIIDMYMVNHKFTTWSKSLKILLVYLLMYSVCLFGTYVQDGVWLYPIFNELDWPQRAAFVVGTIIASIGFLGVTKTVHYILWGNAAPEKAVKKAKNKKKSK